MATEKRSSFEARIAKRCALAKAEESGQVADSLDVRRALMERVSNKEITIEQAQAELKKIKSGAKRAGKVTRTQAFNAGR